MSLPLKSQLDLYNLFITILQDEAPELTDTLDGSDIDALAGVCSLFGIEIQRQTILAFNKTFIDLANGPEITGGPDDLQTLAVDHYGEAFARPGAVAAVDVATFSRPTTAAGTISIPAGTIVKTQPDANGNVQRYSTNSTVSLTGMSISVGITAIIAGSAGNATVGKINVIETTLLDSTITVSNAGNATGEDPEDDATYRETIRNLISALRAATKQAIQSAALTVAGVAVASAVEVESPVVFWNIVTNSPLNPGPLGIAEYFLIPFVTLYIADSTGSANASLIAEVQAAIEPYRAFGVNITVVGATPITINWTAQITLNPSGPNYALFSTDTTEIEATMASYIAGLPTGTSFVRATANAYMLGTYGPSGTNDFTAFTTTIPTGDVTIGSTQNAIPGTMGTV